MSELHKFLFEGLPVRGILLRLTDAWKEILQRRAQNAETGAYPEAVRQLLGEMTAGAVLMQANIRFEGALVLQIFGDGPLKLAVVEVQNDLSLRATAKVVGTLDETASLSQMVNQNNQGKCAITLDPLKRHPGQQPYQGVVPLFDDNKQPIDQFQKVIEHYMLQSEQLDTTLILAANDEAAAGLLIQRMPMQGQNNLSAHHVLRDEDAIGKNEDYRRISILASSLTREELLSLDANALLHRLFWQENVRRFEPQVGDTAPRFSCSCSRERVSLMIRGLGQEEAQSILQERDNIEVGCDFCGLQYSFDPIDTDQIFSIPAGLQPPSTDAIQ